MPAEFDACMAKDWPGITDKAAFCAWLTHEQTGQWPAEKSAFSLRLPVAKYDDKDGIVTGWAALSSANDKPLIDFHNDLLLVSELEKAAHQLMLEGGANKAGEMHANRVGDIVESMVLSKEKAAALGLGDVKTEGWIVSMKLRDNGAKSRAKSGEHAELSIHGVAKKIPVGQRNGMPVHALVDLSVDEISIVDRGASGNEDAQPKIVLAKRREPAADSKGIGARFIQQIKTIFSKDATMTLDDILAKLTEEERAIVLAAIEEAKKQPAEAAPDTEPEPAVEMTADQMAKIKATLPEPIRKQLEDAEKAKAEADKAKSETAELKKRMDERDEREEIAKFHAMASKYEFLAGSSTEEIAKTLRAANKVLKPKEFETLEKILKNANEAVKGSPLFKNSGGRGNESDMLSAEAKIEALAQELRKGDPKLTKEMAVSKALDEIDSAVYQQYKREMAEAG